MRPVFVVFVYATTQDASNSGTNSSLLSMDISIKTTI